MKVAFGTVVYDASYKFHKDFVESINNQDTFNFDVLLLNDNLCDNKCHGLTNSIDQNVVWVKSEPNITIPQLRIELIKAAKEKEYDLLILGDFDDTISKNRVSKVISHFDSLYSFFYNDLYYLDSKNKFFYTLPLFVEEINPILECNFLGLSNTALNMHKVDFQLLDMLKTMQTVAFDWMIFSLLLIQGHKGKKVDNCKTYYRIYEQNTAGESNNSIEGIKKEIEVKIAHYSKLINVDFRYSEIYNFYIELRGSFDKCSDMLLENSTTNNQYWWGSINKNNIQRRETDEDQK